MAITTLNQKPVEVTFRVDGVAKKRHRVFFVDREHTEREWREGLAVCVLGDFGGWYRIEVLNIRPIVDEED